MGWRLKPVQYTKVVTVHARVYYNLFHSNSGLNRSVYFLLEDIVGCSYCRSMSTWFTGCLVTGNSLDLGPCSCLLTGMTGAVPAATIVIAVQLDCYWSFRGRVFRDRSTLRRGGTPSSSCWRREPGSCSYRSRGPSSSRRYGRGRTPRSTIPGCRCKS